MTFDRAVIDRYLELAGICETFTPRKSGYCATCQGLAGDHFLRRCLAEVDRVAVVLGEQIDMLAACLSARGDEVDELQQDLKCAVARAERAEAQVRRLHAALRDLLACVEPPQDSYSAGIEELRAKCLNARAVLGATEGR